MSFNTLALLGSARAGNGFHQLTPGSNTLATKLLLSKDRSFEGCSGVLLCCLPEVEVWRHRPPDAALRCSPAIGNAFAVLSNPEKRLRYDELGSDREPGSAGQARHYDCYTEFEADITPEEIFNVFFGGHFPTGQYLPAAPWKRGELALDCRGSPASLGAAQGVDCTSEKSKSLPEFTLFSFLTLYTLNAEFKLLILAAPLSKDYRPSPALLSSGAPRRGTCQVGSWLMLLAQVPKLPASLNDFCQ